jgi:hypothetical protein
MTEQDIQKSKQLAPDVATLRLGFLSHVQFSGGESLRGGLLVTDSNCKPLEFRCTSPVKPDTLQRTLYGQTMMSHIAVELIGAPLLKSVQIKPAVVLIRDELFFDVRMASGTPVIQLQRQDGEIKTASAKAAESQKGAVIDSASGKFRPVVLSAHWQFPDELPVWRDKLRQLFAHADLIEPFERLAKALEMVDKQGVLQS